MFKKGTVSLHTGYGVFTSSVSVEAFEQIEKFIPFRFRKPPELPPPFASAVVFVMVTIDNIVVGHRENLVEFLDVLSKSSPDKLRIGA